MNAVITGANGFIGSALAQRLAVNGHSVTGLVRDTESARRQLPDPIRLVAWDAAKTGDWREAIAAADIVVHLAGASIGGRRWTAQIKRILRSSRIDTTRAVVDAMRDSGRTNITLLSGSAVGYYGDGADRPLTESDPAGTGFLADMCAEWEAEAARAEEFGTRVVRLRIGIVLGEGGALEKMLTPFRMGVGGPIGSGRQWFSWIHLQDAISMIALAAGDSAIRGPLNVTSPNPVTIRELAAELGRVLHRPSMVPVPGFLLKVLLGEFADSLLTGQRVLPKGAEARGFQWKYPGLGAALRDILKT